MPLLVILSSSGKPGPGDPSPVTPQASPALLDTVIAPAFQKENSSTPTASPTEDDTERRAVVEPT